MFTAMFAVKQPYEKILRWLYAGLALLNLIVILTALLFLYKSREDHNNVAQASAENLSRALEWHIADTFESIDLSLRFLTEENAYLSANAAAWEKTLAAYRGHLKILDSLQVAGSAGNIVHGLGTPGPAGVNVSDCDYFISLRDDPKAGLVISWPQAGRETGTRSFVLARRLSNADGSFAGTIMAGLPLEHFQKLFSFYRPGKSGSIALRDGGLRLMVRSPALKGAVQIGSTKIADEFAAALKINPNEGLYTSGDTSIDGIRRLHYYRRNAAYDFYINVGHARDDFLVEWKVFAIQNAFLVGLFLAASIFLARYLKHAWGQEHAQFEKLRETQAILAAALDTSQAGIAIADAPTGVLRFVNKAGLFIRGGDSQSVVDGVGINEYVGAWQLFDFDGRPLNPDEVPLARAIMFGETCSREFIIQRGSGDDRIVLAKAAPIIAKNGQVIAGIAVFMDITELKRAELALQAKNAELERFTYAVSHDLKSPLVTIMAFLGHLVQDMAAGNRDDTAKDLAYITSAARKMNAQLDELLKLSRLGSVANQPVESPLQDIVQEAVSLVAGRIDKRGVRVQVAEKPVMLNGDRVRLVEVFQNLIDNAVKFMGDQPEPMIEIGAEIRGGETACFVRDNGMGIDPRYKDKLFGLFEKLNPEIEGTGLGLAMVKRIIEMHGGRIWVESEGLGKGACFWFTLAKNKNSRFKIPDSR